MSQGHLRPHGGPQPGRRSRHQASPRRPRQDLSGGRRRARIWFGSLGALIVVAAATVTTVAIARSEPSATRPEATLTNPVSFAGVSSVAFSPGGTTLATGDTNGSTYLWKIASSQVTTTLADPHSGGVTSVAFSPRGTTLAVGDANGSTYLWDPATGQRTASLADPPYFAGNGVTAVAFSPDGATLATSGGGFYLWDIATKSRVGVNITTLESTAAFSPDGKMAATGQVGSGIVYLWNTTTAREIKTLTNPGGFTVMDSIAFSPDGSTLAAGFDNGTTYLWNLATSRVIATLTDPGGNSVTSLAFSPDGKTLVAGDHDGSIYFWPVASSASPPIPAATLTTAGDKGVNAVAFSPNGAMVAVGCANGKTYLWHAPA